MTRQPIIENAAEIGQVMTTALDGARKGRGLRSVYRASVELTRNLTVEARARQFRLVLDEPPSFGGADAGPNPEEVVLAGVGACQAMTAALYASFLGLTIRRYHVELKGYADLRGFYGLESAPSLGFNRVVCEVTMEADGSDEKLKEFESMVESRCVGHGTLREAVSIESRWQINGTSVEPEAQ